MIASGGISKEMIGTDADCRDKGWSIRSRQLKALLYKQLLEERGLASAGNSPEDGDLFHMEECIIVQS